MFDREEEKLKEFGQSLDKTSISEDELDAAIMKGFLQAKEGGVRKRRSIKWAFSAALVAIILLTFVTTIRVSPAFAAYVSNIPGMEKIVEIISNDKGMMMAIENDYYQEIGEYVEKDSSVLLMGFGKEIKPSYRKCRVNRSVRGEHPQ
jgi:hypothetical protein